MGAYYDEIKGRYYDDDWYICADCKYCNILVNEEASTVLCEGCNKNICVRCLENGDAIMYDTKHGLYTCKDCAHKFITKDNS